VQAKAAWQRDFKFSFAMLHCNIDQLPYIGRIPPQDNRPMSNQLKLSATLSLMLMTGFALLSQVSAVSTPLIGG
jgi:hypothetical protein